MHFVWHKLWFNTNAFLRKPTFIISLMFTSPRFLFRCVKRCLIFKRLFFKWFLILDSTSHFLIHFFSDLLSNTGGTCELPCWIMAAITGRKGSERHVCIPVFLNWGTFQDKNWKMGVGEVEVFPSWKFFRWFCRSLWDLRHLVGMGLSLLPFAGLHTHGQSLGVGSRRPWS